MLKLAPQLELPDEAALQRFAILAMTGAGKSNTAAVMAEEMYDAGIPWVAIDPKGDWWGMRSSRSGKGDGLKVPVLGGLQGDVPLEPTAGKLMGETVAAERLTCILDVSEFDSKAEQLRFLTDFAQTLLKKNRDPLMVFAEEADEYLPQRVMKTEAQCVGAWSRLIKRGRFRGVFCTLITQRSAALNKDALNQIDTLIPMRTTAPRDRKAVEEWVVHHDIGRELLDSLTELEDGEAWVWSPQKLKLMERIKLRRRRTFDSGETPTLGTERVSAKLANVDLSALTERMAETIEEQKRNDPTELRKQIAQMKRERDGRDRGAEAVLAKYGEEGEGLVQIIERLASQPSEPKIVEVAVFPEPLKKAIREMLQGLAMGALDNATEFSKSVQHHLDNLDANFELAIEIQEEPPLPREAPKSADTRELGRRAEPRTSKLGSEPPRPSEPPPDLDGLKKGEAKMLMTLAQHHPLKLTRVQLGTLAGFTARGGTFRNYFGTLKRGGLLLEEGKDVTITEAGFNFLGSDVPPPPETPEERTAVWRSVLKAGERQMLDVLIELQGGWISREDLGERTGFTASGGTFRNYLGTLTRNGLAEKNGSDVRAADVLFIGD